MLEGLEILLLFIVHGYFVYSKSMWIGLWKCQFFKIILLLLLEWENEKSIIIGQADEGMVNVYCIISPIFPTNGYWWQSSPMYTWEKTTDICIMGELSKVIVKETY